MSEGSLFNSGFLGASFSWWIGQIADNSTWRDNIIPGKFESADQIPGWGRRYKVRIIGLHDQGETEIASDQLPWAQVMYPVTAGGGQAKAGETPNLSQGNMVFGFFLDGQDQQVPVIMGVLGNNAQTSLATKIGDSRVTNTQPGSLATSGYSEGKNPYPGKGPGSAKPKSPDEGLVIKQPTASLPGATIENVDAIHLQSNADTKRLDLYLKKTVMLSPCDVPSSAMKGMQTDIDNLTKEIDKILQSARSYVDTVSQIGGIGTPDKQIQSLIEKFVPKIAKYMKIVFNKILEFTTKQVNKVLGPLADIMFPNQRFQFFDIKIEITEVIRCLFTKITENLPKQILGTLTELLLNDQETKLRPSIDPPIPPTAQNSNPGGGTTPFVPICYVEDLTGSIIAENMGDMDTIVNTIVTSVGNFLKDIQLGQISGIEEGINITPPITIDNEKTFGKIEGLISNLTGSLPDIDIPDISASIVAAFSFENISMNIFGCDLKPNCPVSDFYSLQEGAGAAEEAQLPRPMEVVKAIDNPSKVISTETLPFATPSKDMPDLSAGKQYSEKEFSPQSLLNDKFSTDDLTLF